MALLVAGSPARLLAKSLQAASQPRPGPLPASCGHRPQRQPPRRQQRRAARAHSQQPKQQPKQQQQQQQHSHDPDGCLIADHHHASATGSIDVLAAAAGPDGDTCPPGSAQRCQHDANTRCSLCDLTTRAPVRDADWTALIGTLFRSSKHDSAIFALAVPAVLALAADPLLSMVDTIFAGADALAALGVNSALFTFSFVVFNFLATATTPMVASSLAVGDKEHAGKVTLQALGLAMVLGTVLAGCLVVFSEGALSLMGAGPEAGRVHELATEFLVVRALAAPAALLMTVGQGAFRGLQDMKTPLAITLAANAINLALDIVLIMGLGWGVRGAATATTTAEWVAALAYLGVLYRRRDELGGLEPRLVLGSAVQEALEEMAPFLRAGGAMLMRTALLLGTKTLASATAARLGVVPIAAHQVVTQLWLLSSLIVDSVAIAGQTLVAVQLGKGDVREARAVSNRLLGLGIGGGVALAGAFWLAEPIVPGVFSNDPGELSVLCQAGPAAAAWPTTESAACRCGRHASPVSMVADLGVRTCVGVAEVIAAVREILPIAVAMLPVNAAVYVFDGIITGAADFKFMAGTRMGVAGRHAVGVVLGVEAPELGLPGVWYAMGFAHGRPPGTIVVAEQSEAGPLPPSAERLEAQPADQLPAASAAAPSSSGSSNGTAVVHGLGSSSAAPSLASSTASTSLDVLDDLSNNVVESSLPPQGSPAWREAGPGRKQR
ncbi:hypothetical protein CHLNCDRAFT_51240 [Chlorella variabilis]|uniref:Protein DETOXIFICATION n=1 Tax=Chlorella variabilis TaxID=554065 RepID=E1ZB50_CHLVA|nr:hypothetical protein CHLNCDRAFT_51240 [Chlorella variabilis]EFN56963.1 hypothetical protein CHLNCDRAFT_51240 [Chlorella variabilis]|eukprot:XP_005849065.1 hypothetical protein CHLNCDRAFT_51240 [Chlorella variabilis]